jgi:hypothetical protein
MALRNPSAVKPKARAIMKIHQGNVPRVACSMPDDKNEDLSSTGVLTEEAEECSMT